MALIYGLPVGVMLAYPILGKRLFSEAELRVETACNNAMLRNYQLLLACCAKSNLTVR